MTPFFVMFGMPPNAVGKISVVAAIEEEVVVKVQSICHTMTHFKVSGVLENFLRAYFHAPFLSGAIGGHCKMGVYHGCHSPVCTDITR